MQTKLTFLIFQALSIIKDYGMNYRWPISNNVTQRLLTKPLQTASDLIGKEAWIPTIHPLSSRLPITENSFEKIDNTHFPKLNGDFRSILAEVYGQNSVVWAHIPKSLMEKLGFTKQNDFYSIADSWVEGLEQSTGLKGLPQREQDIHNKAINPSDYWHQDSPNSGSRITTVIYEPKQVKQGHFELSPRDESQKRMTPKEYIQRIPNTTNAYTLATLDDDFWVHRAQKREPLAPNREMIHPFKSYQRFPSYG
jgi:hypothetical protein